MLYSPALRLLCGLSGDVLPKVPPVVGEFLLVKEFGIAPGRDVRRANAYFSFAAILLAGRFVYELVPVPVPGSAYAKRSYR